MITREDLAMYYKDVISKEKIDLLYQNTAFLEELEKSQHKKVTCEHCKTTFPFLLGILHEREGAEIGSPLYNYCFSCAKELFPDFMAHVVQM